MASDPLHRLTGPPAEDENNSWARRLKKAMGYPPFERLTPRELQVIELVAQGKSNKEIARALCVTSHTAKAHISSYVDELLTSLQQ